MFDVCLHENNVHLQLDKSKKIWYNLGIESR
jgi:hypothetical protein